MEQNEVTNETQEKTEVSVSRADLLLSEQSVNTEVVNKEESSLTPEEKPENKIEEKVESEVKTDTAVEKPAEEPVVTDEVSEEEVIDLTELDKQRNEVVKEKYGFETYQEAYEYVNTDFDNDVSEVEAITQALLIKDPGITEEELESMFLEFDPLFMEEEDRKKYMEEKNLTEDDMIRLDAKFSKLLRESREEIKKDQQTIDLQSLNKLSKKPSTEVKQPKVDPTVQKQKQKEAMRDILLEQYKAGMEDTFKITDKDGKEVASINYKMTEKDAESATSIGSDVYERWINQDGSFNVESYKRDMHYLANKDQIHSVIYSEGLSAGKEHQVKDLNNIDFSGTTPPPPNEKKISRAEAYGLV